MSKTVREVFLNIKSLCEAEENYGSITENNTSNFQLISLFYEKHMTEEAKLFASFCFYVTVKLSKNTQLKSIGEPYLKDMNELLLSKTHCLFRDNLIKIFNSNSAEVKYSLEYVQCLTEFVLFATQRGVMPVVRFFVNRAGFSFFDQNLKGTTLLIEALNNKREETVFFLIKEAQADIYLNDGEGFNLPLQLAVEAGLIRVVDFLYDLLFDTITPQLMYKMLLSSVNNGFFDIAMLTYNLIILTTNLTADDNNADHIKLLNKMLLLVCSDRDDSEFVNTLIANGANVDAIEDESKKSKMVGIAKPIPPTKKTALHLASENGFLSIVKLLLSKGANINAKDKQEKTALHLASTYGHLSIVELLLSQGADVNAEVYRQKATSLHLASANGHLSIVELLLSKGADINAKDFCQQTALHLASVNGHKSIIELLLSKGANINAQNNDQQTTLHLASTYGHLSIVELLISKGADVNAKDNLEKTALHLSSSNGHLSIVESLILKGADVHAKDNLEKTALHLSSSNGHLSIVESLILNGADVHAKDREEKTALHLSSANGHLSIVDLLILKGADVNEKDVEEKTSLHLASIHKHLNVVKFLILKGVEIDAEDIHYNTALRYVLDSYLTIDIINFFLLNGADVNKSYDETETIWAFIQNSLHLKRELDWFIQKNSSNTQSSILLNEEPSEFVQKDSSENPQDFSKTIS